MRLFETDEEFEEYGARFLERMERGDGEGGRFDAVLIDEAQDFARSGFNALSALKEHDGDLIVAGDGSQKIYQEMGLSLGRMQAFTRRDVRSTESLISTRTTATQSNSHSGPTIFWRGDAGLKRRGYSLV